MKLIWYILAIAIVIIVKVDGDGNDNPNTVAVASATTNLATNGESKVAGKEVEYSKTTNTAEKVDLERISDVSQVTEAEPGQPNGTSASSDTGPLITPTIEQPKTESTPERPRVEGKSTSQPSAGLFTTPSMTGSTSTKSISCTSAPTHHRKAESLPTSTTSSPPEEDSMLPTTSETTMTESSTEKTSVCCSCTNSGETPVKPTSDVSRKNGGIIATGIMGNNLSVKGINKSPVMAIIITVSFLAVVTFMSFCYRRRGDISYKVRTWSIRVRQFDFNSLRPVCLRWKKPNSESNPILVFKVDESELDVLTENMV